MVGVRRMRVRRVAVWCVTMRIMPMRIVAVWAVAVRAVPVRVVAMRLWLWLRLCGRMAMARGHLPSYSASNGRHQHEYELESANHYTSPRAVPARAAERRPTFRPNSLRRCFFGQGCGDDLFPSGRGGDRPGPTPKFRSLISRAYARGARGLRGPHGDMQVPAVDVEVKEPVRVGVEDELHQRQLARIGVDPALGADLEVKKSNQETEIILDGTKPIITKDVFVPGDFSSAAFLIGAALISKDADICIKNVGINPTRIGFLEVLKEMNANIKIENVREANNEQIGDIHVKYSPLKSVIVAKDIIPNIIDELPLLSVLACFAEGETKVSGAKELRVKESDRLSAIELMLKNIGVEFDVFEDGFNIIGKGANYQFSSGNFVSLGDHRIAMCSALCALKATENIFIDNVQSVTTSFPNFFEILEQMGFTIEEA